MPTYKPDEYGLKFYRERLLKRPFKSNSELWSYLSQSKTGYHFMQQVFIHDKYRLDFYCKDLKLAIVILCKEHLTDSWKAFQLRSNIVFLQYWPSEIVDHGKSTAIRIMNHCDQMAIELDVKPRLKMGRSACGRIY